MANPYDIYDTPTHSPTMVDRMIENPWFGVGWLGADLIGVPLLVGKKGLAGAMGGPGSSTWKHFKQLTRAKYGSASAGAIRDMALHGKPMDFARPTTPLARGGGVIQNSPALHGAAGAPTNMARDRMFHQGLRREFGRSAARRIGAGRLLHGLSRGLFAYSMLQLGIGLMRGINDMIEAYEPPEPKVPWHRDLETGGGFVDTRSAQTQRQRAIQAIHNTQLSTRAALGNEASFLHMQHR